MTDDQMQEVSLLLEDWQGTPWRVDFRREPAGIVVRIVLPNGCEVARSTLTKSPRAWLRSVLVDD